MNNENHGNQGNNLFAFLLGGAVGAVIGLLYAPRPGKETRKFLIDEGNDVFNKAVSSIHVAQDKALSTIKDAQTRVETLNEQKESVKKATQEQRK
ncbi:MAG TPA: YtxH domain-containing protein [Anaerolineales bacterium]|nr:YtxH domain-containing protein [Anaerolineales bacterium]